MDLKLYYQKIRDTESKITEAFPVVVSNETPDGGKAGVLTEVTPGIAAKMLVEGSAHLATPEEANAFRAAQAEAKRVADQEAAAAKLQFTVLSTAELNMLKSVPGSSED
jgi:ribosomal protein L9